MAVLKAIVSLSRWRREAYRRYPDCNGGLYCFDMESSEVTNVLENMTDNCREIKNVARFKGTLVFTEVVGRQLN